MTDLNQTLFDRARLVIPGGVNSPVRAFRAVGGDPVYIQRAEGPYLYGADGAELLARIKALLEAPLSLAS